MSEEQCALQTELVARYDRLRNGRVDPRVDNALAITTDGRKLALDARLLSGTAADFPGSKINALVENVTEIWRCTAATRGTQLIFSDMGVNRPRGGTPSMTKLSTSWSSTACRASRLPRSAMPTPTPRNRPCSRRSAPRRPGADRQHAEDGHRHQRPETPRGAASPRCPLKPAEVEQRDGRILRQGNTNEEVSIFRYVTEGSFDAYMWQALETKARFINQVMTGDSAVRQAEDIGSQELSYAEVKAIASGNPAVLTLAEADAELKRLTILKKHHADEQYLARRASANCRRPSAERRLADLGRDIATATTHAANPLTIGARTCTWKDALDLLGARLQSLPTAVGEPHRFRLGTYRGLSFSAVMYPHSAPQVCVEGAATRFGDLSRQNCGPWRC